MKERMKNLKKQRDLLVLKKQEQLKKEWDNFEEPTSSGDSRKDMINKGLGALGIKEGEAKYQTEEQKEKEIERKKEERKKRKEESKEVSK